MDKIRVLIVERSPQIRKALTEYLSHDADIAVVGVASNQVTALKQIERLEPDIITLEEPLSDDLGIHAITELRKRANNVPILTLGTIEQTTIQSILNESTNPKKGSKRTKPSNAIVCKCPEDRRFTELCRRIHQLVARATDPVTPHNKTLQRRMVGGRPRHIESPNHSIRAIGIAVSTGGPNALLRIVQDLTPEVRVPILVTQHMPGQFTTLLAERLAAQTPLSVVEAQDGDVLQAGRIYLAPGDYHLGLEAVSQEVHVRLSNESVATGCRPSADVMFRAMADIFGPFALGIVLTGMGTDGQVGCQALKEGGAYVIAQDESTSTVFGMPKAVIAAGFADEVLPLHEIAGAINQKSITRKRSS